MADSCARFSVSGLEWGGEGAFVCALVCIGGDFVV